MKTIDIKKRIHKGWFSDDRAKAIGVSCPLGKYQYIYSSSKGKISLIELPNYWGDGKDLWEIYTLKGNLFDDVERFDTKKSAEKRIKELLN